jgi:hypothetical protein
MSKGIYGKSMRRHFLFCLVIVLITFGLPSTSKAATDGCPDMWSIDTSQNPNSELGDAKFKLGPKMVQTVVSQKILEYKGETGSVPKLDNLLQRGTANPVFIYLYGKSTVETIVKVEVKDCIKPQNFTFNHLLYERKLFSAPFEIINASTYAKQFPNLFIDFKKQEAFSAYIANEKLLAQSKIDKEKSFSQRRFFPTLLLGIGDSDESGFKGSLPIIPMTENCVKPSAERVGFAEFTFGKKCQFAWLSVSPSQLGLIEPFILDLTLNSKSVTCIKGKTTKKVSGTNPKCPKGYKKASS